MFLSTIHMLHFKSDNLNCWSLKPRCRGVYIYMHAVQTEPQELCGRDVGTTTCSISSCLVILSQWDPVRFTRLQRNLRMPENVHSPSARLRGWCWAACTRHPPSSHGDWIKAAHDGTSARAHCSLQRQAMSTKVSPVRNVVWNISKIREWFQLWCLILHLIHVARCWGMHKHSPCSL